MTIANRLNESMMGGDGREKISQSELSRRSGVPQPTIARILKGDGKKGPETETLVKLSRALGVEFMWLQQGGVNKFPGERSARQDVDVEGRRILPVETRVPRHLRYWLDDDEAEFLAQYRSLTKTSRARAKSIVSRLRRDDVDLGGADEM